MTDKPFLKYINTVFNFSISQIFKKSTKKSTKKDAIYSTFLFKNSLTDRL